MPKKQQFNSNKAFLGNAIWHVTCKLHSMKPRKDPVMPQIAPFQVGPSPVTGWRIEEGRINLVRDAPQPRTIELRCGKTRVGLDLNRAALVVIDMQNDFCHPLGWFGQKGIDVSPMRAPIPVLERLLPTWRSAGGRVLWLNWGIRPDRLNLPPMVQYAGKRTAQAVGYGEISTEDRGRSLVSGEWGAQVVDELQQDSNDVSVNKHRLSGFWDNELDSVLKGLGLQTLLFAGVNTDRCVFSTLQDAGFLGYDCILVSDACATPSPRYVSRAIHYIVERLHGFICTSSAIERALARPQRKPSRRTSPGSRPSSTSPSTTQGASHETVNP
jgi:ureidoacrylate peracid hydrolase